MTHLTGDPAEPVDCEGAASLILEADLDELRGAGDGGLARHLRACASCRRKALSIVTAEARLSDALDERASMAGVEDMLGRVRRELAGEGARRAPATPIAPRPRWKVAVPLAAAATVAALLLWSARPGPDGGSPDEPLAGSVRAPHATPVEAGIRVEADRRFALMKTDRPTISVVWFY